MLVLLLGSVTALGPLSIDMYLPAFPDLVDSLHAKETQVQLTLSAYLLGMAVGQLVYGTVIDRFGRRTPLMAGLLIYAVASFGATLSVDIGQLMMWRLVQALGGAVGVVSSRAVIRDLYGMRDGAQMLSSLILVMGAAPVLAPLLGAQVLLVSGWRTIFALLGIYGMICLYAVFRLLPDTLPPTARLSRIDLRSTAATYWRLLRHAQLTGFGLASGLGVAGMFAYISGSPVVFIEVYGTSPQTFSLLFGINASGFILASQLNRRLLRSYEPDSILTPSTAVFLGAAVLLLLAVVTGVGGLLAVMVLMFVLLFSLGMMAPNATVLALEPFKAGAGSASAITGSLQLGIGAISGALVGLLANGTAVPMAGLMFFCAALAWLSLRRGTRARALARPG